MVHDFRFEVVPLSEAAAEPSDEPSLVLVVDDEPLIVDTVAAVLARSGLSVAKAYSGRAGLEMALDLQPDLLLTDYSMPGMNGIDLAMAVSGALPRCKVMLFSGQAATLDMSKPRLLGYEFVLLAKPLHPLALLKNVRECLDAGPHRQQSRKRRWVEDVRVATGAGWGMVPVVG